MNERLLAMSVELRDLAYDAERLDDCDEIRDIVMGITGVSMCLRVMAYDPRYDVERDQQEVD